MEIILWRHAEAKSGETDDKRALSVKGRKQAAKMAEWLDANLPQRCKVLVSPSLRTVQTAEALGRKFRVLPDLGPDADPFTVLSAANWPEAKGPVVIVGHQPALGQIAALLMSGTQQDWRIRRGDVWWLAEKERKKSGERGIFLRVVMSPEMIGSSFR
ncbi:MAG: histidine phosphatase family protein [Oxalobacter sp.]|nr:MAG: histidine phosphatase family protein [Oxalobacter sp.]